MHIVLTRVHPGPTSWSVTHPRIAPSQARLTLEFFSSGLPEKKEFLVDMSSLSFLLSQALTIPLANKDDATPEQNSDRSEEPSKRRRRRKQSKANKGRGAITGIGENDTPVDPVDLAALEQP